MLKYKIETPKSKPPTNSLLIPYNDGFLLRISGIFSTSNYLDDLIYFVDVTGIKEILVTKKHYSKASGYEIIFPKGRYPTSCQIYEDGKILYGTTEICDNTPPNVFQAVRDNSLVRSNQWRVTRIFEVKDRSAVLINSESKKEIYQLTRHSLKLSNSRLALDQIGFNSSFAHLFPIDERLKENQLIILPDKRIYEFSKNKINGLALSNDGLTVAVCYVENNDYEVVVFDI